MFIRRIGPWLTLGLALLIMATLAGQCETSPSPSPTDTVAPPRATPTPRPPVPTTGPATLRLEPDQATVQVGQTVELSVVIDHAANLGSFEFAVNFDPAVVCVTQITLGPFLGSTGRDATPLGPKTDCAVGQAKFGAFTFPSGAGGPSGSGILAVITFQALASGRTDLALSDVKATDISATAFPIPTLNGATLTVQ